MRRRPISRGKSRKVFRKKSAVHSKNRRTLYRGGIRL